MDALLDKETIEIQDILALTPEIMRVCYKDHGAKQPQPLTNNVPLGVFVT